MFIVLPASACLRLSVGGKDVSALIVILRDVEQRFLVDNRKGKGPRFKFLWVATGPG